MARRKTPKGLEKHYGKWRAVYVVSGVRHRVSTGLPATRANVAVAQRVLAAHRERTLLGDSAPTEGVSFNDACDKFLTWKGSEHRDKPATVRRVDISLRSWRVHLEGVDVARVEISHIQDYMVWRRQKNQVAEVTLRKDLFAARQLFRFCRERKWMTDDPMKGIAMPSDKDSLNEVVLTDEEEWAYLGAADADLNDLARIMLHVGLRPSEVLALRREHVNVEDATVRIVDGKSRAAKRTLWLDVVPCQILSQRMKSDWLWPNPHGRGAWKYKQVLRAHKRACEVAGLEMDPYSLRHTFATRFYARTKDLVSLSTILGHSDIKTTMRYVNDREKMAATAMKLFAGKAEVAEVRV